MAREYIIYADESAASGRYFSNFYGGALVRSSDIDHVRQVLEAVKEDHYLRDEIKWSKVTAQYLSKYTNVIDTFFDLIEADRVKIRIMFTQNRHIPQKLNEDQIDNHYFLLYYQFIKHAFGLQYSNLLAEDLRVRVYLDQLPDTREKCAQFKGYIASLSNWAQFRNAHILFSADQIAEVVSHHHVVLQCLDIVLGAMYFRLNDLHLAKPEGMRTRGKRTIAKEQLYKHILDRIRRMQPQFNIGMSTSDHGDITNRWNYSYSHWLFKPTNARIDDSKGKKSQKS